MTMINEDQCSHHQTNCSLPVTSVSSSSCFCHPNRMIINEKRSTGPDTMTIISSNLSTHTSFLFEHNVSYTIIQQYDSITCISRYLNYICRQILSMLYTAYSLISKGSLGQSKRRKTTMTIRSTKHGPRSFRNVLLQLPIIVLVILFGQNQQQRHVYGYSTYLLSRAQCWTQLDIGEIIMNQPIKSVSESSDPDMQIRAFVASDGTSEEKLPHHIDSMTVRIPQGFPAIVSVHVVTTNPKTHPDYQWVMDVIVPSDATNTNGKDGDEPIKPKAHFVDGSCTNRVRVAGRGDETVSVTIEQDGAQLIAGWANGYEAVKLTPIVTFLGPTTKIEDIIPPAKLPSTTNTGINNTVPTLTNNHLNDQAKSIKDILFGKNKKVKDRGDEAGREDDPQKKLDTAFQAKYGIGAIHQQIVQYRERAIKERESKEKHVESGSLDGLDDRSKSRGDGTKKHTIKHRMKKNRDPIIGPTNVSSTNDDQYLHRQSITDQEERIKEFMLKDKVSSTNDQNNNHNQQRIDPKKMNDEDNKKHPFRIEFRNLFGERTGSALSSTPPIPRSNRIGITSSSYLSGGFLLVLSIYASIHICIWASKRTPTSSSTINASLKGRLDL